MSPAVRSRRADASREALRRERAHHRRSLLALHVVARELRAHRMMRTAAWRHFQRTGDAWHWDRAAAACERCERDVAAIYEARWSA